MNQRILLPALLLAASPSFAGDKKGGVKKVPLEERVPAHQIPAEQDSFEDRIGRALGTTLSNIEGTQECPFELVSQKELVTELKPLWGQDAAHSFGINSTQACMAVVSDSLNAFFTSNTFSDGDAVHCVFKAEANPHSPELFGNFTLTSYCTQKTELPKPKPKTPKKIIP